jgi:hypothetical protein
MQDCRVLGLFTDGSETRVLAGRQPGAAPSRALQPDAGGSRTGTERCSRARAAAGRDPNLVRPEQTAGETASNGRYSFSIGAYRSSRCLIP